MTECENAREVEHSIPWPLAELGHAYAVSGRKPDAESVMKEFEDWARKSYVPAYNLAEVEVGLGHKEQALSMLEKAYADRSMLLTLLACDPQFDGLHSTPRFKEVVRRVGLSR